MTPERSTPTWSFFHPRRPRAPYFGAAHSPSPTIDNPVLSMMRWMGPSVGRWWSSTARDCPRRESVVWSGASRSTPINERPTARTPPLDGVASGRQAGASTRSRSRRARTSAARPGDHTVRVATWPRPRARTTGSRRLAGPAPAHTRTNCRRDTSSCTSDGPFDLMKRSCPAGQQAETDGSLAAENRRILHQHRDNARRQSARWSSRCPDRSPVEVGVAKSFRNTRTQDEELSRPKGQAGRRVRLCGPLLGRKSPIPPSRSPDGAWVQ